MHLCEKTAWGKRRGRRRRRRRGRGPSLGSWMLLLRNASVESPRLLLPLSFPLFRSVMGRRAAHCMKILKEWN